MKHVVIADDLTGANATGVLLKKEGLEAVTFLGRFPDTSDADACIFSTDSRGIDKAEAYKRVFCIANQLRKYPIRLFSKRIDSTMRGNAGAEIDGLLDALGSHWVAVCTPAYPDAGRTLEQGKLLVNGIQLTDSVIANDPKSMIHTSCVKEIISEQSKYAVYNLYEEEICGSCIRLSGKIDDIISKGYRIIVCDAVTNDHIENIAQAIALNKHLIITADSGVLAALSARKLVCPKVPVSDKKILAVVGSVNPAAKLQLEELWASSLGVGKITVNTKELIHEQSCNREICRIVLEALSVQNRYNVLTVVSDGIYPENRIRLTEQISGRINDAFGIITLRILEESTFFKGLYTSGGDITKAVYDKLNAEAIRIQDQVLPLAVYGQLLEGKFPGLLVVTKGGSQGNNRAIEKCVRYLFDKIQTIT